VEIEHGAQRLPRGRGGSLGAVNGEGIQRGELFLPFLVQRIADRAAGLRPREQGRIKACFEEPGDSEGGVLRGLAKVSLGLMEPVHEDLEDLNEPLLGSF